MNSAEADTQTVQQRIEAAKPGERIEISKGEYAETLIIDKPIHLIGHEGATFVQTGPDPIITIQSNHVRVENLSLVHTNDSSEATILINGDHNVLHNFQIQTNGYGVYLDKANDNKLSHLKIEGNKHALVRDRQHGMMLKSSHRNEIHHTSIQPVMDGIYLDAANGNHLYHNVVRQSRYGYHLMFTRNTVLEDNESSDNVNGMMIMSTNGTIVNNNTVSHNQQNPQSIGLFMFDVSDVAITNNKILYNRIGIFIDDASNNELKLNLVQGNYVGLQFRNAKENNIHHNSFIANVVQGQAGDSEANSMSHNYWGDHLGLDLSGDGVSDLPYKIDPFFLKLTNGFPPFQLLFQAPGMVFLKQLIHTPVEHQLVDYAPLMINPLLKDDPSVNQMMVLLFSITLFIFSTIIIYLGVKKQ